MENFEEQFRQKIKENNITITICKYCKADIIFMKTNDTRILPFNLDFTKHNCK